MSASPAGAVVIGGYANALAVVRSLGECGIPVAVLGTEPFDIAPYSRYCREAHALRGTDAGPDSVLALLEGQSSHWRGWALYPTNDEAQELLALHRDALSRTYRVVAPPFEVARVLLHKAETCAAARAVGIDVPRSHGPADAGTAERADLTFPVVVKPHSSHRFARRFGRKLFLAADRAALRSAVARLRKAGLEGAILDYVPGGDDAHQNVAVYLDRRGDLAAALPMHKLRKNPPFFGVCRVAETSRDDALVEPTVELLRRLGFRGMANAEYKLDPRDGRHRLMEVNGRPFLMQGLARRAGVDLPHLAWRERVLGERVRARANGWSGVWVDLHADLLHGLFSRRAEGLRARDYAAPYLRPKTFAVWDPRDPRPFVRQWAQSARNAVRSAADPARRRALAARVQVPPAPRAARDPAVPLDPPPPRGVLHHLGLAGSCHRLDLRFDAPAVAAELAGLSAEAWRDVERNPLVQGSVAAFYALGARWPAPGASDLPILKELPRLRRLLHALVPARPQRALVAKLPAGAFVPVHTDAVPPFRSTLRLLFPIATNPGVRLWLDGRWYRPRAGEVWVLDNLVPHAVRNDGEHDRIFLLADYEPTRELVNRLRSGDRLRGTRDPAAWARTWLRTRLRYGIGSLRLRLAGRPIHTCCGPPEQE